jgi:hypothetical protein
VLHRGLSRTTSQEWMGVGLADCQSAGEGPLRAKMCGMPELAGMLRTLRKHAVRIMRSEPRGTPTDLKDTYASMVEGLAEQRKHSKSL